MTILESLDFSALGSVDADTAGEGGDLNRFVDGADPGFAPADAMRTYIEGPAATGRPGLTRWARKPPTKREQLGYWYKIKEAGKLLRQVRSGDRYARAEFAEAMTTADFPLAFGDVLDRSLLARWEPRVTDFRQYVKVGTVNDFRVAHRYQIDGGLATLDAVGEYGEYKNRATSESRYPISVNKYGAEFGLSWESMVNDDLGIFDDLPPRLAEAAQHTDEDLVTNLYTDSDGPKDAVFASGDGTVLTSNPVLSIAALQTAITTAAAFVDSDGNPIRPRGWKLVVPPGLEVTAANIMNQLSVDTTETGGSTNQTLRVANWITASIEVVPDPRIPLVATTNGDTTWFMFPDPGNSRPAFELAYLRGHERPRLFVKTSNQQALGGGAVDPMDGDFDNDGIRMKVRHVVGVAVMEALAAMASDGTGS